MGDKLWMHLSSRRRVALGVAVAAATLMAMPLPRSSAAAGNDVISMASPDVTFVTGGISSDAVDHMKAIERDFNVKMVFALNNGEYVADVRVQVVDSSNNVVLDTVTEGPLLLARLPAGSYQVSATYGKAMEHRVVAVAPASLKTLDFRWATE